MVTRILYRYESGDGWVYLYSVSSAAAVECESSFTLVFHAPPKKTSVLVLFVIFGGL